MICVTGSFMVLLLDRIYMLRIYDWPKNPCKKKRKTAPFEPERLNNLPLSFVGWNRIEQRQNGNGKLGNTSSFVLSCITSTSESLRVMWPTLCSLPLPERRAPACALSRRQTATPHLGCAPSSESRLFPSPAQRRGIISLLNYASSLTLASLRTN